MALRAKRLGLKSFRELVAQGLVKDVEVQKLDEDCFRIKVSCPLEYFGMLQDSRGFVRKFKSREAVLSLLDRAGYQGSILFRFVSFESIFSR